MEILETRLHIDAWKEEPYREEADGRKWTRADVTLTGADGLTSATMESLMFYRPDGTSTYVSLLSLDGSLDGRPGSLVLHGTGSYDGTTASSRWESVAGTDGLADVTATAESVSTHGDYPYMPLKLRYT
jgi:hypothetical protein